MAIVKMKKLRLIAVRSQQKELMHELMLMGCVEISEPKETEETLKLQLTRGDTGSLLKDTQHQQRLISALSVLDEYAPAKRGLLTPLPEVELERVLDEKALPAVLDSAESILALKARLSALAQEESRLRASSEALAPWSAIDHPLEAMSTGRSTVMFGTLPAQLPVEQAQQILAEQVPEAELIRISGDGALSYCVIVALKEKADEAVSAVRHSGWTGIALNGYKGTPAENISAAGERIAAIAQEREELIAQIASRADERMALQLGIDTLTNRISCEESAGRLLNTDSSFIFTGWFTAPDEQRLTELLSRFDCAWEIEDPDPEHPEEVPIKLKNNKVTDPFNLVTEMYSLPAYNGLDPNPFIAPFFALFFGIMFADMAYGIILLIAGLLVTFKARPRGGMKQIAGLLIICGISTTVIGFLSGGFFGDVAAQIGSWFGQEWSIVPPLGSISIGSVTIDLPLDLLSGNNPLYVLILAICLGAVHLALGVGLGMYLKIKDGQYADALLNDLCWWVIIAGLGLMLLGKTKLVLYIGIGMLVLGSLITNKGIGKITGLFGAVYNGATGYLGDFLSYSRLMALMLAGSVIASVFNQLGGLGNKNGMTVGGTILFVFVFLIGHALNFGLNLIGCFVHTLRLQFLEFFGKWYRDGGKAFRPLHVKSKYADIKQP